MYFPLSVNPTDMYGLRAHVVFIVCCFLLGEGEGGVRVPYSFFALIGLLNYIDLERLSTS